MQYHMSIYWNFKVNWICIVNKRQISILCTHSKYMGWYIILVHEILQLFFKNFDISFFFADQGPMTKESTKKTWKGKVAKQWKRIFFLNLTVLTFFQVKWPSNGNECRDPLQLQILHTPRVARLVNQIIFYFLCFAVVLYVVA